jgi:hypothetical protein
MTDHPGAVDQATMFGNTDRENQTEALSESYRRIMRRRPPRPVVPPVHADEPHPPSSYDKLIRDTET